MPRGGGGGAGRGMKVTLLLQVGVGEAKLDRVGVRVGDMLSPPQRPSNCFGSEAHLELGGARGVGQSGGRLLNKVSCSGK